MSRATSAASRGESIGVLTIVISAVLLIVGVFVYVGVKDTSAAPAGWVWLLVASVALLGVGFGVWLLNRGMREGRILRSGLVGQAAVVNVSETGMGVGGGDHDGGGTAYTPILRINLRVVVPGHPPYETSVREIVPLVRRLQLHPGLTVAVKADPRRLSRVVIDWEQAGA